MAFSEQKGKDNTTISKYLKNKRSAVWKGFCRKKFRSYFSRLQPVRSDFSQFQPDKFWLSWIFIFMQPLQCYDVIIASSFCNSIIYSWFFTEQALQAQGSTLSCPRSK